MLTTRMPFICQTVRQTNLIYRGPVFFVANFAKFRGTICEILRHYYSQIPYTLRPVGIVVLTDNTSKYKEFIVTCNTTTHYINNCNYHKSKLTTTRFYSFINGKIKKGPKKLELDINVAKNGQFRIFPCGKQQILQQTANSMALRENLRGAEYCWPC